MFLFIVGCTSFKTQYYIQDTDYISIRTIDSINTVHKICIPTNINKFKKSMLKGDCWYTMYSYIELKQDTLFIFSITIPENTKRSIIKLRKEIYEQ
jgi:hypothetical protein